MQFSLQEDSIGELTEILKVVELLSLFYQRGFPRLSRDINAGWKSGLRGRTEGILG